MPIRRNQGAESAAEPPAVAAEQEELRALSSVRKAVSLSSERSV